jgi:hypothetical protein
MPDLPPANDEEKKEQLLKVLDWMCAVEEFTHHVYPCTIIPARYSGHYEGGQWLAFNCYQDAVPLAATGDDCTCMTFWDEQEQGMLNYPRPRYAVPGEEPKYDPIIVGKGESPNLAVADLARKLGIE